MKTLVIALGALLLNGCATYFEYSAQEECAMNGMTLAGVTNGQSHGSATAYNYYAGNTTVNSSGYSRQVHCTIPQSPKEKCEIDRLNASLAPIREYNGSYNTKKWITGVGYVFYIIPGVVAKVIYDNQFDSASNKYKNIYETFPSCE